MDSSIFFIIIGFIPAILLKITMAPLNSIKTWSPFKIDALGIVTLLGADAIRKTLGRLVYSPFEYFPLLAGHLFADNSVADAVPGFVLYNITEGVMATDLSAWFTRYLLCQKLTYCSTELTIRDAGSRPLRQLPAWFYSATSAVVLNMFLILWPLLIGDWYGFAASLSLVALVLVRVYILWDCRASLDAQTKRAGTPTKTKQVKLFITLPTGDRVTVRTTTGITQDCLLTEARPRDSKIHQLVRTICWFAFGVHAVSLGMACLVVQLVLVTLTLVFSVAAVQGYFVDGGQSNETRIGNRLLIKQRDIPGAQTSAKTYALLDFNEEEEQNMLD